MDLKRGLLCSLTNEFADFEENCPDFEPDLKAEEQLIRRDMKLTGDGFAGDPMDFKKNKEQGYIVFGLGLLFSLFLSFLGAAAGIVYFVGLGAIVVGIRQYMRGAEQEKKYNEFIEKRKKREEDLGKENQGL